MASSMLTAGVSEPYAQALMSLAQSNNVADQIGDDALLLLDALKNSEDLRGVLANPLIKIEPKKEVLRAIIGDRVHPFTRNFLMLLIDRRRILFLEGIFKQYLVLLRQLKQTVLAEVISTVPLTEAQQQIIRTRVTTMTSAHQVELETKLDPELIGGVIIKVGSQVIDASLRGQLRRISLRLSAG